MYRAAEKNWFYGRQTEHASYPAACALDKEMACWERLRYLHPSRWYLLPVSVMYTVSSLVSEALTELDELLVLPDDDSFTPFMFRALRSEAFTVPVTFRSWSS